jgi:hypothetical protein
MSTVQVQPWLVIRGAAGDQRIGHVAPDGSVHDVAHLVVPPSRDLAERMAYDRGHTAAKFVDALNALDDTRGAAAGCVGD